MGECCLLLFIVLCFFVLALDEKLLSREVVLDADTLTPRGSLLLAQQQSSAGNLSNIKRRRRQKASTANATVIPTPAATSVAAVAPATATVVPEKGFADYEFSDDEDVPNVGAGGEPSAGLALSFRIRPHATARQTAGGDSSPESSSPVSVVLPPPSASGRRSRRNNPRPSSAQLSASGGAGGSLRLGGDSTEDMLDDNADSLLRLTPPKGSPVLARQSRRRAGTGNAASTGGVAALPPPTSSLSTSSTNLVADKPNPSVAPVRTASGMPIFPLDDDDEEGGDDEDEDEDDEDEDEEDDQDSALRRFCSHTLATRLAAEKRSRLGGVEHRGRVPWIAQCCIERLMSKTALEARNLLDGDQVSLADVNALAERLHESASSGRYAAVVEAADVRVVAALLFTYLQRLPDGVVPSTAFASFVEVDVREGESKRRESRLARLARALPATNRALLSDIVHWAVLWAGHAPSKKLKKGKPPTLAEVSAILAPIVLRAPATSEFSAEQAATMVLHLLSEASSTVGAPFYVVGEQMGLPDAPLARKPSDASEDMSQSQSVESYSWNPFIGAKFVYTYDPFAPHQETASDEEQAGEEQAQSEKQVESHESTSEEKEEDDEAEEVVPQITPPRPAPGTRKRPTRK
jgi:hypothetical protein